MRPWRGSRKGVEMMAEARWVRVLDPLLIGKRKEGNCVVE